GRPRALSSERALGRAMDDQGSPIVLVKKFLIPRAKSPGKTSRRPRAGGTRADTCKPLESKVDSRFRGNGSKEAALRTVGISFLPLPSHIRLRIWPLQMASSPGRACGRGLG